MRQRILVANRGEIARRIFATASRLGHQTVAVFAEPDAAAPFVADADESVGIGPAALSESYLSIDKILQAATVANASAIHPGYGFLSENPAFAKAVVDAGLIWVGPSPNVIAAMGSKIQARRLAVTADVDVIPGFDSSQDAHELATAATAIGYPVLIKASGGGGGKGIRIANTAADFAKALNEAKTEAARTFGDDRVIVERYVDSPRHIEVQIVGDKHGSIIHLGTRDCSVQRRYQKLFEEAPARGLDTSIVDAMTSAAVRMATSVGYDSAGTVEFVVDGTTGEFFFLEMNTRLQVEHPVTELVTGIDLVELQIRVAQGEPLGIDQADVTITGHAIEARLNAEDWTAGFIPQTGTVNHVAIPGGARWDSSIEAGSVISPHYDPMIAKLIVGGRDRDDAMARMRHALDELLIVGVSTTAGFHRWLLDQPQLIDGQITTRFLDDTDLPAADDVAGAADLAAAAWREAVRANRANSPWSSTGSKRLTPHINTATLGLIDLLGHTYDAATLPSTPLLSAANGRPQPFPADGRDNTNPAWVDIASRTVAVNHEGQSHTFSVVARTERWAPDDADKRAASGAITAPFPAVVADVLVSPGDDVASDDPLVVIEAMKMLHTLAAPGPGRVASVSVTVGDQVESAQVLVTFDTPQEDDR
ncbi:MAG: ATP-grasp domain-containing protein [Actinobacteria bacterium]|nr:ATP-grasp domain-containing protein [Actinomycetota bacterium]